MGVSDLTVSLSADLGQHAGVLFPRQSIDRRRWQRGDAIDERAGLDHPLQDSPFALRIEQTRVELLCLHVCNAGCQGIGAPVADAADDEVIGWYSARDEPAVRDVAF